MAVFRIERTRDYTVMSNHHLRNANLSLKAKGLLSMMLSLPEDWNYTTRGLAKICKEGVDAIALRCGNWKPPDISCGIRDCDDRQGRISRYRVCHLRAAPARYDSRIRLHQIRKTRIWIKPDTEKPAELNIEKSNTEKSKYLWIKYRFHSLPGAAAERPPERKGRDAMSVTEIESYRELIQENIGYDC